MIDVPGIYDVSDADYHADRVCAEPSLSASICQILVDETPRHARHAHPRLNPTFHPVDRDIYDAGRAAHAALLGQRHLIDVIDGFSDWRKEKAKAARETAREAGLTPILADKMEVIDRMVVAVHQQISEHEDFPRAFTNGRAEQTLVWFDGTGADRIVCRARLDWLPDDGAAFIDLKTTGGGAGEEWGRRTMFSTGADVQAAFYTRGIRAVLGIAKPIWAFCVIENYEPHCLMFHTLEPEAMAAAEVKVQHAIDLWRRSMKSGVWPGYPRRTNWVSAPPWELARAQELSTQRDEASSRATLGVAAKFQAPL